MTSRLSMFVGFSFTSIIAFGCGDDTGSGASGAGAQAQGGHAEGGHAEGGQAEGGQGGQAQGGEAQGGEAQGGAGGGAPETLEEACETLCTNAEAVESELQCEGTPGSPTCVPDCVARVNPACEAEYMALVVCQGEEVSADACMCGQNGGLSCDTCTAEKMTYVTCVSR